MSKEKVIYTWETDGDAELWRHDEYDTIEDCVLDYIENYNYPDAKEELAEEIYVGEIERFKISVNADDVLERLDVEAYEECGESAECWNPLSIKETGDLSDKLTEVVNEWLKKNDCEPNFSKIVNIKMVKVADYIGK